MDYFTVICSVIIYVENRIKTDIQYINPEYSIKVRIDESVSHAPGEAGKNGGFIYTGSSSFLENE